MRQLVMWLNSFPVTSEIYTTYLIAADNHDWNDTLFKKNVIVEFGSYVETYEHPDPKNGMYTRTMLYMNLGPTGDLQGTHKLLNLRTGRTIKRWKWTELPIPKTVIVQVAKLAAKDKGNPVFEFSDIL